MKYRPDIDGLRAVAVMLVIGFHAFPAYFPAGFIGVDIFFVISGFLITTIILTDLRQGSFSFRHFYARRVRRLFPALIVVIAVTGCIGWLVLYPVEFERLGKHIAAGMAFVPNIIFSQEAGYFDTGSEAKPLLHLWSLGIEEQFYVVWPITLLMLFKLRGGLAVGIATIAIASFWSQFYSLQFHSGSAAFYLPMNRAWELLIGAGLAWMNSVGLALPDRRSSYLTLQSLIGIALIAAALAFSDSMESSAGLVAVLPLVGTILIIATPNAWLNQRVLGCSALVYLGLISYPLYLWHWPLLSFAHILGATSWQTLLIAIAMSILLAVLTYEIVEKRIKANHANAVVTCLVASSVFLLCVGLISVSGWIGPRNNSNRIRMMREAREDWEYPVGLEPFEVAEGVRVYRKRGTEKIVLFLGDSHIEQYAPRITTLIAQDPMHFKTADFATLSGCFPIPDVLNEKCTRGCSVELQQALLDYSLSPQVESVVVGACWNHYLIDCDDSREAFAALEKFIAAVAQRKRIYLVIDNPAGDAFSPERPSPWSRLSGILDEPTVRVPYNPDQANLRTAMIAMAHRTNAIVIDPVLHFCENGLCRAAMDDGTPIYKDSTHLRATYVKEFADFIDLTVRR